MRYYRNAETHVLLPHLAQNHSTAEVGRDLWVRPAQPSAQAGPAGAGCSAPHPGGF